MEESILLKNRMAEYLKTSSKKMAFIDYLTTELENSYISDNKKESVNSEFSKILENIQNTNLIKDYNNNKNTLIEHLVDVTKSLDTLNIEMSFYPSDDFLDRMYSSLSKIFGSGFILSPQVSSNVKGGLYLTFKGEVFDYTLERKINDYFDLNRDAFRTILHK